jgi:plastocyanin
MGGKLKWLAGLAGLAGLGAACGSNGDGGGGVSRTIVLSKEGGDAQTAVVGSQLPLVLRLRVREGGADKAGATVTWQPNADGVADPQVSTTSSTGEASTAWTLGTTAGPQTVAALSEGTTAIFTANAMPGPAASLGKASGDGQSTGIGTLFGSPLAARVTDQYLNGVEGLLINWSVQSGDVTLAAATSVTNTSGLAAMQVTAGPGTGSAVVRATTSAVAGSTDFTLTITQPPIRVSVGNIYFQSLHNGTSNPAVDTASVGTPVIWTATEGSHLVRSQGSPSFQSGLDNITAGKSYTITFSAPGTYEYDCGVHGSLMTGRVVVIP